MLEWVRTAPRKMAQRLKREYAKFTTPYGDDDYFWGAIFYFKGWGIYIYHALSFWQSKIRKLIKTFATETDLANLGFSGGVFGFIDQWAKYISLGFNDFIEYVFHLAPGTLAQKAMEAEALLKRKLAEIAAEIRQQYRDFTQSELQEKIREESAKWEASIRPTAAFSFIFSLIGNFFDLIDNLITFKKAVVKVHEVQARTKLSGVQSELSNALSTYTEIGDVDANAQLIHQSHLRNVFFEYIRSYQKLIKITQDPVLAAGFLDAYTETCQYLMKRVPFLKDIFSETALSALNRTIERRYQHAMEKARNKLAIKLYGQNYAHWRNDTRPDVQKILNEYPRDSLLSGQVEYLIEIKFSAARAHYQRLLKKRSSIFSAEEDQFFAKTSQEEMLDNEVKKIQDQMIGADHSARKSRKFTTSKEIRKILVQKLAYLQENDDKASRLTKFTTISDLNNESYRFHKWAKIVCAGIMIGTALYNITGIMIGIVCLAFGNPTILMRFIPSFLETVALLIQGRILTLSDGIFTGFLGFFRTLEKYKTVNREDLCLRSSAQEHLRQAQDLLKNLENAANALKTAQLKYQKNSTNNDLVRELKQAYQNYFDAEKWVNQNALAKKLRIKARRLTHLRIKLADKSVSFLFCLSMFIMSFLPVGTLPVAIGGIIVFVIFPILKKFWSQEGKIALQQQAQALGLLPKLGESAEDLGRGQQLLFLLYSAYQCLTKMILLDALLNLIPNLLRLGAWCLKPFLMRDDIDRFKFHIKKIEQTLAVGLLPIMLKKIGVSLRSALGFSDAQPVLRAPVHADQADRQSYGQIALDLEASEQSFEMDEYSAEQPSKNRIKVSGVDSDAVEDEISVKGTLSKAKFSFHVDKGRGELFFETNYGSDGHLKYTHTKDGDYVEHNSFTT